MIDRIFKSWKTTILGLLIIAVGFTFVWFEKCTLTEFSGFITGGMFLIFTKEKQNEKP